MNPHHVSKYHIVVDRLQIGVTVSHGTVASEETDQAPGEISRAEESDGINACRLAIRVLSEGCLVSGNEKGKNTHRQEGGPKSFVRFAGTRS